MRTGMTRRILHLSDTHGLHRQLGALPDADVLVHSGDFTMGGAEKEAFDFMEWLIALPHPRRFLLRVITMIVFMERIWRVCPIMCIIFAIPVLK